jgi:predicted ATPase
VVIVLEDLHWGDLSTIKLIYTAFRALADQPLMLLALARPEIHELSPQLWADRWVQEIRVHKLPRRASAQLVREALGDTVSYETVEALVRRSGRHASYLDELIRAEAEGKGTTTPQTVLAMVQAQIEKLDPEARRVLRAASLFGKTFRIEGIEAVLGGADIAAWIAVLVEQGMIEVQDDGRLTAEVEYGFPCALIQEAAHEMLTDDDRTLGHRLAEQWLEQTTRPT